MLRAAELLLSETHGIALTHPNGTLLADMLPGLARTCKMELFLQVNCYSWLKVGFHRDTCCVVLLRAKGRACLLCALTALHSVVFKTLP